MLVLRPWRAIYTIDDERTMSFEATVGFQRHLEDAYRDAGYVLVEIPLVSIEERVAFVEDFVVARP